MTFYWLLFVAIFIAATGKHAKRTAPMSMNLFSFLQNPCHNFRIYLSIRYFYQLDSAYVAYEKDGKTKWKCELKKEAVLNTTVFLAKEDAEKACNNDTECKYIENEDCSGTEGYVICNSLKENNKSCVLMKEGYYLKNIYTRNIPFKDIDVINFLALFLEDKNGAASSQPTDKMSLMMIQMLSGLIIVAVAQQCDG